MKKWRFLTISLSRAYIRQRRAFQKEEMSNIHQKTGQVPCSVASVTIDFLTIICSTDDITSYTEKG